MTPFNGGHYLYRAVDSHGRTIGFYLSSRRNTQAAYRFLKKMLGHLRVGERPRRIITDKAPTYGRALALWKREDKCLPNVERRQVKYLNNVIECDHGS
ncbi:TPA: DDE-type integrase/transposase/recombinase [Yersinia enterocolitica]|nr:DDE-type integrase/transposase/recombinase [Yersinia enterocolitica]HEN3636370.1 DDE-type integrase/transposase/recombinase [Yersinia enterocolitica]HEN3644499.1 DDE-type integrase/transposase/recombinase [Yersinia enterocolitica]